MVSLEAAVVCRFPASWFKLWSNTARISGRLQTSSTANRMSRDDKGTFGVLTADLVTREEAFVRALLHALAPFYNASAYAERGAEKTTKKRPAPAPQAPPEA